MSCDDGATAEKQGLPVSKAYSAGTTRKDGRLTRIVARFEEFFAPPVSVEAYLREACGIAFCGSGHA